MRKTFLLIVMIALLSVHPNYKTAGMQNIDETPTEIPTITITPTLENWNESTVIGSVKHSPSQFVYDLILFINTFTLDGTITHPINTWTVIDFSSVLPQQYLSEIKSIDLAGQLIITHGSSSEVCNLTVAFRNFGKTFEYPYKLQAIESAIGGGVRQPVYTRVPVTNGKFEVKWIAQAGHNESLIWNSSRQYPTYCSYGINLYPEGYTR